jgi:hypothetical protein
MEFKRLLISIISQFLLLSEILSKSVYNEDPVVCFKNGCVRGKSFTGNLKPFEGFFGIPFALPPTNDLRFKVRN